MWLYLRCYSWAANIRLSVDLLFTYSIFLRESEIPLKPLSFNAVPCKRLVTLWILGTSGAHCPFWSLFSCKIFCHAKENICSELHIVSFLHKNEQVRMIYSTRRVCCFCKVYNLQPWVVPTILINQCMAQYF